MIKKILDKFILHGTPEYATSEEWKQWKIDAKRDQPFAYWLHEIALYNIGRFFRRLPDAIRDFKWDLRSRFFDKYYLIDTGLDPYVYHECDTRMLHGMFMLLVDYVEIELANMNDMNESFVNTPFWSKGWTKFRSYRNKQAGLDYLAWEMTLDNPNLHINSQSPQQAVTAREQLFLYNWWTVTRPARPDPYGNLVEAGKSGEIEEAYEQEDEDMLHRLITIRRSLWT